uniref:hypothetical protein n=1 Tax=Photorhabdus heterorhabditis TaxID=880156 RepID=UPI001EC020ED|nr:hypothetical protein [Photorhabdus heterorhabditis]
ACTGDVVVDKEPDTCCSRWQATALGTRRISTLRLAARPAAVEWVATGRVAPSPWTAEPNCSVHNKFGKQQTGSDIS